MAIKNPCYQCDFNSHAHVERDPLNLSTQELFHNFNSHAHVERDFSNLIHLCYIPNFNSHAHVERDTYLQ